MRTLIAMVATFALCAACSGADHRDRVYGASTARLGESLAVLGWNTSVSNLRWQDDYVLVDVDAARRDPAKPHADPARHPLRPLRRAGASDGSRWHRQLRRREKHCHPIAFRAAAARG